MKLVRWWSLFYRWVNWDKELLISTSEIAFRGRCLWRGSHPCWVKMRTERSIQHQSDRGVQTTRDWQTHRGTDDNVCRRAEGDMGTASLVMAVTRKQSAHCLVVSRRCAADGHPVSLCWHVTPRLLDAPRSHHGKSSPAGPVTNPDARLHGKERE